MRDSSQESLSQGWLISPWFDLLFIANLFWPVLLLWQFADGFAGRPGLQFWQVYFVTTPHRWITLVLVFTDRGRWRERRGTFIGIAAIAAAACCGVFWTTGGLTCLLTIDYLWNAWHFAAQHHGIYRIYTRSSSVSQPLMDACEKWLLRGFLLFVTLRVAGATWGLPTVEASLRQADWSLVFVPVVLLFRRMIGFRRSQTAGLIYLVSVLGLYTTLLWAVHTQRLALALALTTASALFHATEYLAIVGWSVQQRRQKSADELGLMSWLAPRWGLALAMFAIVLGAGGWWLDHEWLEGWLLINVIVAFLHYAYDGLIWRRRPSSTGRVISRPTRSEGSVPMAAGIHG